MDGRFRQHQHRGHRQTMSSEYVFGVKNPFAKFMRGNGSQEEEEDQEDRGGEEEEEEQLEEEKSASAIQSDNKEEEGDEMEEGSETTSNKDRFLASLANRSSFAVVT